MKLSTTSSSVTFLRLVRLSTAGSLLLRTAARAASARLRAAEGETLSVWPMVKRRVAPSARRYW